MSYVALISLMLVCAPLSCGRDEVPRSPREVVREVVTRSVKHQSAMLDILEQHQREPEVAIAMLEAYVRDNSAEIELLARQRPLLEHEQAAFAEAWSANAQTLFERRRRLDETAADLMERAEVTRALSRFDAL